MSTTGPTIEYRDIRCRHSENLPALLSQLRLSVLISTYQTGHLVVVAAHRGRLMLTFHGFDPIVVHREQLKCGLAIVDLRAGNQTALLEFKTGVDRPTHRNGFGHSRLKNGAPSEQTEPGHWPGVRQAAQKTNPKRQRGVWFLACASG
jgi:hypothetical protein